MSELLQHKSRQCLTFSVAGTGQTINLKSSDQIRHSLSVSNLLLECYQPCIQPPGVIILCLLLMLVRPKPCNLLFQECSAITALSIYIKDQSASHRTLDQHVMAQTIISLHLKIWKLFVTFSFLCVCVCGVTLFPVGY